VCRGNVVGILFEAKDDHMKVIAVVFGMVLAVNCAMAQQALMFFSETKQFGARSVKSEFYLLNRKVADDGTTRNGEVQIKNIDDTGKRTTELLTYKAVCEKAPGGNLGVLLGNVYTTVPEERPQADTAETRLWYAVCYGM
jgi:hypothetical protein